MNILDEVKTRLSITGTDLDGTIQGMIDDVVAYCRSAGLKYTQIVSTRAVGLIARGVADLWNYGAGNGKFSDIFLLRLNQMTLDAASLDHDVELQEKSVTITENGTTEITPDEGYTLSGASVSVNVPSGSSEYNVKSPVIHTAAHNSVSVANNAIEIDFSNTTWDDPSTAYLDGLFFNMKYLNKIIWGDIIQKLTSDNISCKNLFYQCSNIVSIDLSVFGSRIITNPLYMFSNCANLTDILWGDVKVKSTSLEYMFAFCKKLETVNASFLDPSYRDTTSIVCMFYQCENLKSVDLSNLNTALIEKTTDAFKNCTSLTDITFMSGCFSGSPVRNLDLSYSPLTHDCAVDIFNKLAKRHNSPVLRLSTTTKGYLTEDEIAIATGKGWVIS